jgi:hypothetical protein
MNYIHSDLDNSMDENPEDLTFDPEKLILFQLYESRDPKFFGCHLSNAESIIPRIIDKIVKDGAGLLMEKYLLSKQNDHVNDSLNNLIGLNLATEFAYYDAYPVTIEEDVEPELVLMDNWARSKIETKQKELIEKPNVDDRLETIMTETRKSFYNAKEKAKKFLKESKHEILPTPIELREPEDYNRDEEEVRAKKEGENRRRDDEIRELQKKESMMEEQKRLAKQTQDLKNKNFTYNYDGTLVIVNQPKMEKLPPVAYSAACSIGQNIKDLIPSSKKKGSSGPLAPVKSKQRKVAEQEKEFLNKLLQTAPPVFDSFNPAPGVLLIEGGKTKQNPKLKQNFTMTDGTLSLSNSTGTIRLSRSEYLQITRGGNLSRQNIDKDKKAMNDQLRSLDSDGAKNWSIKVDGVKEFDPKEKNMRKMMDTASKDVQINYKNFEHLVKAADEIKMNSLLKVDEKAQTSKNSTMIVDEFKKTPIDEFNMEIMNAKDWGKNVVMSTSVVANTLPKPTSKIFKQTMGVKSKYPRERMVNHLQPSGSHHTLLSGLVSPVHETL